jgi:hypothetical protein
MESRLLRAGRPLMLLAVSALPAVSTQGQATSAGSRPPGLSKVEIFGGYSNFRPFNSDIYNQTYEPVGGGTVSATGYLSSVLGLSAEYSRFFNHPDYCLSTIEAGPVVRHQLGAFVPFAHVLGGGAQVGPSYAHSADSNPCKWGWAAMVGGGLDYVVPAASLRNHLAIRPIEADFHYSDVNYGPQLALNTFTGGEGRITAVRLSTGLVYRFGETSGPEPARLGCVAQPVTVFPGDPVMVETSVMGMGTGRKQPAYTWTSTGGKITGTGNGARIDTTGTPAGDYIVTGRVSGGRGATRNAECTTAFRVVANAPPTIACSANPARIVPGGFTTITATAQSSLNRPLNYSYGTSAGQITGTGPTATLAATDVNPGSITVRCNAVDDRGQAASATIAVEVATPPPPPLAPAPAVRKLCGVSFERDRKRPVRVDNEAKACLDEIALQLTRDPNATLIVVGKHDATEKPEAAAERTLNVKQYMTDEKRIDPSRIQLRTGENTGRMVDDVLVPQGATWDPVGTTSFDPSQIHRHGEPYSRDRR